ncbi:MAG: NUDIX hydrolase [Myxococcota bacterium]
MNEVLGSGRFLRLVREGGWEWAERTNASGVVGVAALTPDRCVLFVEQHRPPIGGRVLEMPAGLAGDLADAGDEALEQAAARELEEETGYRAGRLVWLCAGPVSAGMTSEVLTFYAAYDLVRIGPGGGDDSEDIVVHEVPLDSAREWLAERHRQGVMADPKVYAGLYFLEGDVRSAAALDRS